MSLIDTDDYSSKLRTRAVKPNTMELLVADFTGTDQSKDLAKAPNCDGLGRVRHFTRDSGRSWPLNPLPIDPMCAFLGLPPLPRTEAQAFQNAACNWRCWYCYVPFDLLSASERGTRWVTADQLVAAYLSIPDDRRPPMIDLTGGQPDLVPEWVPWTMRALRNRDAEGRVYLWSDDNLSTDYFWRHLSADDRDLVVNFKGYGRVGCFKGWDEASFSFNTQAHPDLFERQFNIFKRLLDTGIDMYAYATFTAADGHDVRTGISRFMDRLQVLHENLPLRLVPLEIHPWTPMKLRLERELKVMAETAFRALDVQQEAIAEWTKELERRFSAQLRSLRIQDVPMRRN